MVPPSASVLYANYKYNRKDQNKEKRGQEWPIIKKSTEFQIHAHCPLRLRMKHLFISCRSRFFFYDSCFQSCFENLLSKKLRNLIGGFKHDGVDLMTTTMTTASLIWRQRWRRRQRRWSNDVSDCISHSFRPKWNLKKIMCRKKNWDFEAQNFEIYFFFHLSHPCGTKNWTDQTEQIFCHN